MKIEAINISGNPSGSMLAIYAHNTRPICHIYEEDFAEILTEAQLKKFDEGKFNFDVPKNRLFDKCKTWFSQNDLR